MEKVFHVPFDGDDEATEWPEVIQGQEPLDVVGATVCLDTSQKVSGTASLLIIDTSGTAGLSYNGAPIKWVNLRSFSMAVDFRVAGLAAYEGLAIGCIDISQNITVNISPSQITLFAGGDDDTYAGGISLNTWTKFEIFVDDLDVTLELDGVEICSRTLEEPLEGLDYIYVISAKTNPTETWVDEWKILSDVLLSDEIPAAEVGLDSYAPDYALCSNIPDAAVTLTPRAPASFWSVPARYMGTTTTIYKCVLTGADDGVDDIVIPIASFQARLRDGDPSYLSCVIPDSLSYEDEILARTNGEIIIYKGYRFPDGTEQYEELARVDYESVHIDRGARSDSATLTGHKTTSSSAPKEWAATGISYYGMQADGKRRIRCNLDMFMKVGDTCIYGDNGGDYFTVGQITCWVSAKPVMVFMEVQEA